MPAEQIHSQFSDPDHEQPVLRVGWGNKAPDIQIGVTLGPVTVAEILDRHLTERVPDLDESTRKAVVEALTQSHDPALGWFTNLDRQGANRLIRILRKARDQSFGADA